MARRDTAITAAWWLVGVSAVVVVALIAATAVAQGVQRAITSRAGDIITNAMPSVKFLSAARGDLNLMDRDIERAGAGESQRAEFERQADSARQNAEEALATYLSLPFFPQEKSLFAHVSEALAVLDTDYAVWKAAPTPGALATVRVDIVLADSALERSITFDADQGQRLGLEIQEIRASSTGLVVIVDGIAVLLALGAVFLALRHLRQAARTGRLEDEDRARREAELRETNEALGQFAGRVAHDVLSPLSTTMFSLEHVRLRCEHDKQALRATDLGMAALNRVHTLVDNLLAFARAGGKPEVGAKAELEPVLRDLVDGLSVQAQEEHIALVLTPVPAGQVSCSPGVLASIVTNLVRNAMKYLGNAQERRVEVRVLEAGSRWHVEVSDTGPGIPDDQQQRIFEPYVRLAKAGAGIGLGLATVDRLVRAHGGTVGVRSKVGTGSTFWFELPKARDIAHTAEALGMQPTPVSAG